MTQGVFLKTLFFYVECFPKRSALATLPSSWIPFSHMRFGVFTCESHQDLGIFAYVQPLYSHLCLLSHTCEYLLSYENRCWCDHKYFNISESVKFFKVLISVPKLDRKAWIFPTFFFCKKLFPLLLMLWWWWRDSYYLSVMADKTKNNLESGGGGELERDWGVWHWQL